MIPVLVQIAALIASLALLTASAALLLRVLLEARASDRPLLPLRQQQLASELPQEIEQWISLESEAWAREELRAKARVAWLQHKDWTKVLASLQTATVTDFSGGGAAWPN